jgi:uncharacterized membrane protein
MKLLLAGETFVATTLDAVGGDALTSATSTNGATAFNAALAAEGITVPQRLHPAVVHPIFAGVEGPLPPILGMNKLDFRNDCSSRLLATCYYRGTDWPLLAVRNPGRGRTLAWATDIGPHWLSQDFLGGRSTAN